MLAPRASVAFPCSGFADASAITKLGTSYIDRLRPAVEGESRRILAAATGPRLTSFPNEIPLRNRAPTVDDLPTPSQFSGHLRSQAARLPGTSSRRASPSRRPNGLSKRFSVACEGL